MAWLTQGAQLGLVIGIVVALAAVALPRAVRLILAVLLMAATVLVNLAPPNPYLALSLKVWQQGHFLNFNGLTRLVSAAWPFIALGYLMYLASRRRGRLALEVTAAPCPITPSTSFSAATSATAAAHAARQGRLADARLRQGRIKALGLAGQGKIRVNQAGCLDRCEEGPCIVVCPEAVWYTYVDRSDIDEIIEEHLQNGRIVERLRM